ncbi:MAG: hypothetical protein RL150_335 [Candidatus Parcubacteria bacterium]|jgi:hypothetical protein
MRFVFVATLLLSFLAAPFVGSAQSDDIPAAEEQTQFYVSDVVFTRPSYAASDVVAGTFTFHNLSDEVVTNAQYRIELVTLLSDGAGGVYPSDALDATEAVRMQASEPGKTLSVPFTYTMPQHVPEGELGILVQTYIGELLTPVALEYVPLTVSGDRVTYLPRAASLIVNDEESYETLAGPTVDQREQVVLELYVENPSDALVTIRPTLSVVEGKTSTGAQILTQPQADVAIAPGAAKTIPITIPLLQLNPAVYTLIVDAVDVKTGVPVFAPIEARLVVAGLEPSIERVSYSTLDLTKPLASFDVTVSYLDAPINFRVADDGKPKDIRVAQALMPSSTIEDWIRATGAAAVVRIEDADRQTVLREQRLAFTDSNEATARFGVWAGTERVRVLVTLEQYGKVIDTYTEDLTLTVPPYPLWQRLWYENPLLVLGVGIGVLCIVVLAVGVQVLRRRRVQTMM